MKTSTIVVIVALLGLCAVMALATETETTSGLRVRAHVTRRRGNARQRQNRQQRNRRQPRRRKPRQRTPRKKRRNRPQQQRQNPGRGGAAPNWAVGGGLCSQGRYISISPALTDYVLGTVANTNRAVANKPTRRNPPAYASKGPTGAGVAGFQFRGPGSRGKQTLWWDRLTKCWRFGLNSYDPSTGASRVGNKVSVSGGDVKVDMCKILPAVCKGSKPAFCSAHANMCCPFARGGCPRGASAHVKGLPRQKMPQIEKDQGANTFNTFDNFMRQGFPTWACPQTTARVTALTPSQDEIELGKSMGLACGLKNNVGMRATLVPHICNDNYILDGHHRWSAFVAANKFMAMRHPVINVRKCNQPCSAVIARLQTLYQPNVPDNTANNRVVKFAGMVEIRAVTRKLYGPQAHPSEEAARNAYVADTLEKLSNAGLSPQEDGHLAQVWDMDHAANAGWRE